MSESLSEPEKELWTNLNAKLSGAPQPPSIETSNKLDRTYSGISEIDLDSGTVKITAGREEVLNHPDLIADLVADKALQNLFEGFVSNLERELDIKVDRPLSANFFDLSDEEDEDIQAYVNWKKNELTCGRSDMKSIEPSSYPMRINAGLGRRVKHEAAHIAQATRSRFLDLIEEISDKTDSGMEYTLHPDAAGIEALSKFEEDPFGNQTKTLSNLHEKVMDPWHIPRIMENAGIYEDRNFSRINGGEGYKMGEHLYSHAYDMAEVIAFTVKNHYLEERVENPVEETRQTLFDIAADASNWERMISSIWRDKGIPDYHKLFEESYTRIQNDRRYAKNEFNYFMNELEDAEEPDVELYNRGKAFAHAYRESGRDTPENLDLMEERLYEMWEDGKK